MAKVMVLLPLNADAVKVWLSVFEPLANEEKSKVTVLPSLMAKVMVLLPLNADAVKVWLSVPLLGKSVQVAPPPLLKYSSPVTLLT